MAEQDFPVTSEFPRPGQPNIWYKAAAGVSVMGALAIGILVAPLAHGDATEADATEPGNSRAAKSDAVRACLEALAARRDRLHTWITIAAEELNVIGAEVAQPSTISELDKAIRDARVWLADLEPQDTVDALEVQVFTAKMIEDRIAVRLGQYRDSHDDWLLGVRFPSPNPAPDATPGLPPNRTPQPTSGPALGPTPGPTLRPTPGPTKRPAPTPAATSAPTPAPTPAAIPAAPSAQPVVPAESVQTAIATPAAP